MKASTAAAAMLVSLAFGQRAVAADVTHTNRLMHENSPYLRQPGLKKVLNKIADAWKTDCAKIVASSDQILHQLRSAVEQPAGSDKVADGTRAKAYEQFASQFDDKFGGFGGAPKFPRPVTFNFLHDIYAADPDAEEGKRALEMSTFTLRKMAEGGIHD